jgi:hypothetical protein
MLTTDPRTGIITITDDAPPAVSARAQALACVARHGISARALAARYRLPRAAVRALLAQSVPAPKGLEPSIPQEGA